MKTKDISICAISLGLLIVGSKVAIPISFIPLTLQTLMVVLLGFILNRKQVIFTFGVFLLGGLCGLPIFANGGGISYIIQPSFGFLLAFPIAAYTITSLRSFYTNNFIKMCLTSLLAILIIYTIGSIYMYMIFHQVLMVSKSFSEVLTLGVIPFILSDSVSACLACIIAIRIYEPMQARMNIASMV